MDSPTSADSKGPQCPYCPGFRMMNSRSGKHFPTCFHCRLKCPGQDNDNSCRSFRGKSSKGYRYPKCPKCTYKDEYKSREDLATN